MHSREVRRKRLSFGVCMFSKFITAHEFVRMIFIVQHIVIKITTYCLKFSIKKKKKGA